MKKSNKLFYAFISFLLVIGFMSLQSCTEKSGTETETEKNPQTLIGTPEKPGSAANSAANMANIIEGHIALPATPKNKMGLVMVHGEDNGIEHPFAYGIPYHFSDAAVGDPPYIKGDDIQFSIRDDGKYYTALNIKKSNTHTHQSNVVLDFSRMINLDDHKNKAFDVVLDNTPPSAKTSKIHNAMHLGSFVGVGESYRGTTNLMAAASTTDSSTPQKRGEQYSIYATKVTDDMGKTRTQYVGIPIASEKLIEFIVAKADPGDKSKNGNQVLGDDTRKSQAFYFTLSDVKLKWLKKNAGVRIDTTIQPMLVREVLPYHWHWYDKAVMPQ
jgi:hypothetical protein